MADLDLDVMLKRLHLANARRVWRELAERAEKGQWTYDHLLRILFAEEVAHRAHTRLNRLSHAAKFPFLKTIDDYDFTFQSTLRMSMFGTFLSPDFVSEGGCLVLSGKPGRGDGHHDQQIREGLGAVLHDPDLAEAIVDRLLERGRVVQLDGPSIRSKHVDPAALDGGVPPAIVSGTDLPDFPEPTPFHGGRPLSDAEGGWEVIGPSSIPFSETHRTPRELGREELTQVRSAFRAAALRVRSAGFRLLEVHAAHGYLLHSFLSPLSNRRTDEYGGSLENRARLLLEVVREVRDVWPRELPLSVRLSCSDWVEDGSTLAQAVEVSHWLRAADVDLIDCSSGGSSPNQRVPVAPGYQVHFAAEIKRAASVNTAAVGLITAPEQADAIIREQRADIVLLGRELLRHPSWPLEAAKKLGHELRMPAQYARAY